MSERAVAGGPLPLQPQQQKRADAKMLLWRKPCEADVPAFGGYTRQLYCRRRTELLVIPEQFSMTVDTRHPCGLSADPF